MLPVCLHDQHLIEEFFRPHASLHIYSIGDLDDFFWPYTTWYALADGETLQAVALLYSGQIPPVLLAFSEQEGRMADLIQALTPFLPAQFYTHLSPGLEQVLQKTYDLEAHGAHYKMALKDPSIVKSLDCSPVVRLSADDLPAITRLYSESYPGNWFDPRMLDTRQYFGLWQGDELLSIAGIHVYSEKYGVAALGNITTHPDWRNRGYGRLVTARLCQSLSQSVAHIGLNVRIDNQAAITCYEKLGFEIIAAYGEFMAYRRS
jgi:predicted GNAT family acetyltransferase